MRWRFPSPGDTAENRARDAILARADDWWKEFQSKAPGIIAFLSNHSQWDLPKWMQDHLGTIHKDLSWEFCPGKTAAHCLAITPESKHHLRPMVNALLSRAPKIEGFEWSSFRPPQPQAWAHNFFQGRTGESLANLRVEAVIGSHRKIGLRYFIPGCTGADDLRATNLALVATEVLLGEEMLDHWIGVIAVAPLPKPTFLNRMIGNTPKGVESHELPAVAGTLLESIRSRLCDVYEPPSLRPGPDGKVTAGQLFTLNPQAKDDYVKREDLRVATSFWPEFWQAAELDPGFHSGRFARRGTFCYLKIDGSEGLPNPKFSDRGSIEDAINAALGGGQQGFVVAGGTGLLYSYLYLSLVDVPAAVPILKAILQEAKVSKRCWLLFFDSELSEEWVGMWNDSPSPPGIPEQTS